jgi:hypothetical protein
MSCAEVCDAEGSILALDLDQLSAIAVLRGDAGQRLSQDGLDGAQRCEDVQWLGVVGVDILDEDSIECSNCN